MFLGTFLSIVLFGRSFDANILRIVNEDSRSFIVQADSVETAVSTVKQYGGTVNLELSVINAVFCSANRFPKRDG